MPLEKLRAALAAKKSVEKSTHPGPLARAEPIENIKLFELNNLGIFEGASVHSINNFQNHQPQLTYAARKSEKKLSKLRRKCRVHRPRTITQIVQTWN